MKFLIAGKNGQLARAFIQRFESGIREFYAPDEAGFNITDASAVDAVVGSLRPDVIINCAAYNLVDQAEQNRQKANAVNALGPKILAEAAAKYGAYLVHFSSDYVFDGSKEHGLYSEDDPVHPLNEYGRSKLAGERAVQETFSRHLICRLSWVFGEGKQNFIFKLGEWARGSEFLKIACDEFSVPTWTETIVDAVLQAVDNEMTGLYHLTNSGYCSRYEWAKFILRQQGIAKFIRPVPMDSFNLSAKRPKFSAMSNARLSERLGNTIPSWEEAVSDFLKKQS